MDEIIQETVPQEPEQVTEETTEETIEETSEVPEAETEGATIPAEVEPEAPPTIKVKFNHEEKELSLDEAQPLVQRGMKWDSFQPQYEKLNFLAVANEISVPELIDKLISGYDEIQFNQFKEEAGGNEALAQRLMDAYKLEQQTKFSKFKATEEERQKQEESQKEQEFTQRMASDFLELQKEFPDKFKAVTDVPKGVIQMATQKKISLYDAYLRYERSEAKKIQAVEQKEAEAKKNSLGSLTDQEPDKGAALSEIERAMLKAAGLSQ